MRGFKYAAFVVAIKDDLIYSSALLIAMGEMRGLHRNLEGDDLEVQRIRVWNTLRSHVRVKLGHHDCMVETHLQRAGCGIGGNRSWIKVRGHWGYKN